MAIILRRRKLGRTSCREIARQTQHGIIAVRNDRPIPAGHNLLIRWGCTSEVAINNVVNTVEAIHRVNDKLGFRRVLNEASLCPPTAFNRAEATALLSMVANTQGVVVRPARHAQGRHLYVGRTAREMDAHLNRFQDGMAYASTLINKVAEYRVFVVQGRVACVAKKTPGNPQDVAWNVARGGRFDNVGWDEWPLNAVRRSVEAFNLSGLDFGGVDVMVDADGTSYILEINSAPSLTSPYRQECMAKCFDYIIDKGKAAIPLIEERGGYRKFIHPAVCDTALMV